MTSFYTGFIPGTGEVDTNDDSEGSIAIAPTKTCPDGSVIPITDECPQMMKTCPDGSVIPVGAECPPEMKTCPDGSMIPVYDQCPPEMKTCPNGSVIPVGAECPATTKTCPNGDVIPIGAQCPPEMKVCPDGSQIPVYDQCPPEMKTCPNGQIIPIHEECPAVGEQMKTCPGGQIMPISDTCPPYFTMLEKNEYLAHILGPPYANQRDIILFVMGHTNKTQQDIRYIESGPSVQDRITYNIYFWRYKDCEDGSRVREDVACPVIVYEEDPDDFQNEDTGDMETEQEIDFEPDVNSGTILPPVVIAPPQPKPGKLNVTPIMIGGAIAGLLGLLGLAFFMKKKKK